ncbi:hypothetical protein BK009_01000 [Methanobacterium subterraneum]|uniref:Uncharacterized protein n=1 Tax=Methanobacterium subterraneum TaxID=59277 RepID=A0A2H4VMQ7_9EURY|nr:hypothetical protein [Methanobacterium subterraneum]AUB59381.1 hypothetical protein BK009_01000 [Methanobacterium subterraneum]
MAVIKHQTKLSQLPKRCPHKPLKPNHLLKWDKHKPEFKKFILLHLIQAADTCKSPTSKITTEKLINQLSTNMGGVVKLQVILYVENLIYQGYLLESYLGGAVTCTDKVYAELQKIDKIIAEKNLKKHYNNGEAGK